MSEDEMLITEFVTGPFEMHLVAEADLSKMRAMLDHYYLAEATERVDIGLQYRIIYRVAFGSRRVIVERVRPRGRAYTGLEKWGRDRTNPSEEAAETWTDLRDYIRSRGRDVVAGRVVRIPPKPVD